MNLSDTIVASATAPGRGAISIIRLSGPKSLFIAETLSQKSLKPRFSTYGHICNNEAVLDSGLWIFSKRLIVLREKMLLSFRDTADQSSYKPSYKL